MSALASALGDVPAWMADAACRDADPDMFFPTDGVNPNLARKVCGLCPVQDECLDYAMAFEGGERGRQGVWAGTSPNQRIAIAKRQAAA